MSSKRRKTRNKKGTSGMLTFQQHTPQQPEQISSWDSFEKYQSIKGVTSNKFVKWVERHYVTLFIMVMIIILLISVANLF